MASLERNGICCQQTGKLILSEVSVIASFAVPFVECGSDGARESGHADKHPHAFLTSRRLTSIADLPRR